MVVVACTIHLRLEGVASLKEKRRIVKSVKTRLANQFSVAVAEVDHHDMWQSAALGVVSVGNDKGHLHRLMEKVVAWIGHNRLDVYIVQYEIEFR